MGQSGEDSLHTALSLLQTLGELLLVLEENDSMFADHVRSCGKTLSQAGQPHGCYKSLFLETQPLQRLETLFREQEKSNTSFTSFEGSKCLIVLLLIRSVIDMTRSLLNPTISIVLELNSEIQRCIYDTLMSPIHQQISLLGSREWADIISSSGLTEDLPEFGLAPMEYITQIGQYLMMLPQHLEPFVLQENRGLTRALSEHNFPNGRQSDSSLLQISQHSQSATDLLLGSVASASASALSDAILRIESVGSKGAKQLAADIGTSFHIT